MNNLIIRSTQNFITSRRHIDSILNHTGIGPEDHVIEIGAGRGHFTRELARRSRFVTAVEIDPRLCERTRIRTAGQRNLRVVQGDILTYDFPRDGRHKVFGSIPFAHSSAILRRLAFDSGAEACFLIVERGFWMRLTGMRSALSLLVLSEMEARLLMHLPRSLFHPRPGVDCVLISLTRRPGALPRAERMRYRQFVTRWVNGRRRELFTPRQLTRAIRRAGLAAGSRPDIEQFLSLYDSYRLFGGRDSRQARAQRR